VHTIAVLRGEKTEAVLRHGHDRLTVFGIGAEHAAPYWRALVRQLIALGALDVDTQGHGGLFLVEDKARPILRGEAQVLLRQTAPRKAAVERPTRGIAAAAGEFSQALFDALRAWRASEAKSQAVPPYVIFHDATLREIAAARPASLDELGQIKGVGASKLQRYGGRVLRLLGK
jgi:ATP-dependent DNA helicase RecQ